MMMWLLYIRFIVPVLGVFYGTALIADEVDDKTITYLFTRPVPRGAVLIGKYLAYLACTALLVLPSVVLVYFLIVPLGGGSIGESFPALLIDLGMLVAGLVAYGAVFAWVGARLKRPLVARAGVHVRLGAGGPAVSRVSQAADRRLLSAGAGAARDAAGLGRQHPDAGVPRGAAGHDEPALSRRHRRCSRCGSPRGRSSGANTSSSSDIAVGGVQKGTRCEYHAYKRARHHDDKNPILRHTFAVDSDRWRRHRAHGLLRRVPCRGVCGGFGSR